LGARDLDNANSHRGRGQAAREQAGTQQEGPRREMLIEKVISAIKEKWLVEYSGMEILIQQDNASPHVLPNDVEVLAAANSGGWRMRIFQQPAQTPSCAPTTSRSRSAATHIRT
jgi:hypothetical protein